MWPTNIFRIAKNALLISKFAHPNSHISKISSYLINYHRPFHYSTPLFKKKKQKPPHLVRNVYELEKQNIKGKHLVLQDKKFQELTNQTRKELKKSKSKKRNKNLETKQNVTIKKLEDRNFNPYYLIVDNDNQNDAYFCFESTVKEGWSDLVNNWEQINEVEIEFEEKEVNFKVYKQVISLYAQIKFDFVKKPKKQKREFISPTFSKKVKKQKLQQRSWVPFKPFQRMWEESVARDKWKSEQLVKNNKKLQKNFKEKGNFKTFIELPPKK